MTALVDNGRSTCSRRNNAGRRFETGVRRFQASRGVHIGMTHPALAQENITLCVLNPEQEVFFPTSKKTRIAGAASRPYGPKAKGNGYQIHNQSGRYEPKRSRALKSMPQISICPHVLGIVSIQMRALWPSASFTGVPHFLPALPSAASIRLLILVFVVSSCSARRWLDRGKVVNRRPQSFWPLLDLLLSNLDSRSLLFPSQFVQLLSSSLEAVYVRAAYQ